MKRVFLIALNWAMVAVLYGFGLAMLIGGIVLVISDNRLVQAGGVLLIFAGAFTATFGMAVNARR
ncbi:MAG: hypothetical protein A2256_04100 [Candidatus Staskawiczbacteria bacterium RIFOXYA2_FULL_32_7]|nr:MAG: hypothetical protein A2256_04100 [Candidatus Staskawiczbacteria bacterium RIFOXYA2_FULL_32_7]